MRSVLAAVLLLGLALRFAGIGRELPHRIEPDAFLVYELQSLEGDPALGGIVKFSERYPSLVPRALALLPYPAVPARVDGPGDEAAHLAAAARPFRLVRALVALASSLSVLGTWFLARRFLSPAAALAATFTAATSLLALLFATQARPHGVQAALALAAVLAALRLREKPTATRLLVAALAAAAAAATLQNGLFTLAPLAAGILLAGRGSSAPSWIRSIRARIAVCAAAVLVATAAALAFYPGLPYVDAQGIHLGPSEGGAHSIRPTLAGLGGVPALLRLLFEHDPLIAILSAVGIALGLVALARGRADPARRFDRLVVLAYVAPYLAVLALDPNVLDRFLLPLIPFLACAAGAGAGAILERVRGRHGEREARPRTAVAVLAGVAIFGPMLFVSARFTTLAAGEDTLEKAAAWIRQHVDARERILSTPLSVLPLLQDRDDLRANLEDPTELSIPWMAYQKLLPASSDGDPRRRIRIIPVARRFDPHGMDRARASSWIDETQAAYVLLEDLRILRTEFGLADFEQAARERGDLAFEIRGEVPTPDDVGPIEYQGARRLWWRLLSATALGPGVRIYRIRR